MKWILVSNSVLYYQSNLIPQPMSNNIFPCDKCSAIGDDMSLARLIKWIGLIALIAGIIGFLLPGGFIYFPLIDSLLTLYGNALIPGISSNPAVKMLIVKAPVILLAVIGFGMVFWGTMKGLLEPHETTGTNPKDSKKSIKELVDFQMSEGKKTPYPTKSVKELADRKKP